MRRRAASRAHDLGESRFHRFDACWTRANRGPVSAERAVDGYEPFTPSDPDCAARDAQARRRAAGRGQQQRLRHHQVSHAVDLVARSPLRRADRRAHRRRRRAAGAGRGQSRRRRGRRAAVEIPALPHPHLPADRVTDDDCARVCTYAAERIGFDYDVKNCSTCCAICSRCRSRSAGGGA